MFLQAAHAEDVAFVVHRVHHAAGAEEEAGLEKRVRYEMKDTRLLVRRAFGIAAVS